MVLQNIQKQKKGGYLITNFLPISTSQTQGYFSFLILHASIHYYFINTNANMQAKEKRVIVRVYLYIFTKCPGGMM